MLAHRIEMLQRMPIFGAISDAALQFLLDRAGHREVARHQAFFREGEPGDRMFVLETGRARVVKGWHGNEVPLHSLGPGDCFGEMALMDLYPRSASVIADADCTAIELTPDALAQLFEHDAEQFALIQMNIGREVCRRLRAADEELFRLRMHDAGAGSQQGSGGP